MSTLLKEANRALNHSGGRMTAQRLLILQTLEALGSHPSAEEIYQAARAADPTLNLSTVYRTLRWLEKLDLVSAHHFHDGNHQDRYDPSPLESHYHFHCRGCGRIIEFNDEQIERIQSTFTAQTGCSVHEIGLVFYGLCPACQAAGESLNR
jgi:Fe2+ or Zn2+ uptake regulation protein